MRFLSFDGGRVGYLDGDEVIEVTSLVASGRSPWPPVNMPRLIAGWPEIAPKLDVAALPRVPLTQVHLECPIQWPNKIIAFPANYRDHIKEMKESLISKFSADGQGFFLKANSSLSGPLDPIVVPGIAGREVHHESELAIIIGTQGRQISRDKAYQHIFGYSCLVDVVVRGKEERAMRKSFDSFCPVGPYLVTSDEVTRVDELDVSLLVNGQRRQHANTRDLIVDIPGMIEMASSVMTLYPGDIIASGTPAGVGPIAPGDELTIEIEQVGRMTLAVRASEHLPHTVWKK